MLWIKFMFRKTNANKIFINVELTIDDQLSKLFVVTIECFYNDKKRTKYETKKTKILKLFFSNQNRSTDFKISKYFLTMHKSFQLLTALFNLSTLNIKFKLKSINLKKLFDEFNFFEKWFSHFVTGEIKNDNVLNKITILLNENFKLKTLIKNLRNQINIFENYWQKLTIMQIIRNQNKIMIFVQISVTNVLIYVMLKLIKLKVDHINAYMINIKKQAIVNKFNKKNSKLMTLMMLYVIAAMKLNFQNDCWRIHCFEQSHNIAIVS